MRISSMNVYNLLRIVQLKAKNNIVLKANILEIVY